MSSPVSEFSSSLWLNHIPLCGRTTVMVLFCFFKSSSEDMFLLIFLFREREEGGEKERNINVKEKHQLVVYHMRPDQGLNPQPRYAP